MSQGFDKLYPPDAKPAAAWGGFAAAARTNQSAVNSWHAGTTAPTSPEDRQRWLDTSVTPNVLKIWDAASSTWKTLDFVDITTKEVKDARGTASTLDARLDQALNEDGTLKASTTLNPDEFKAVTGTPTRTSSTVFTKVGDQTAIYTAKRRVKMTPGPNYSRVVSSSFAASTTTVTVADTNVPVGITAADVGIINPTAATTGVDAQSLASPTGGYIEDYIATDIKRARRGLAALFHDFDEDPATTTALTWGHKSGILKDGTVKAAGTVALTDAATNYVELDPDAGTLSKNTTGFTATSVPVRKVVTAGGAQTSSVDSRPWLSLPGIVPTQRGELRQVFRGLHLRSHPDSDSFKTKVMLVHADEIVTSDGARRTPADRLVADITVVGINGLRSGQTEAASTWYKVIYCYGASGEGIYLEQAKNYLVDQSLTNSDTAGNVRSATTNQKLGQSFQVSAADKVERIDVFLLRTGTPTGQFFLTIEADSAGSPSGTALATSDKLDASKITTSGGEVAFIFRTPASLATATTYWIVAQGNYTINGTDFIDWRILAAGGYANGAPKVFDGTTWSAVTGDHRFKLYLTRNDNVVTPPTGFNTGFAQIGWVFNDSGSNFVPFRAFDRDQDGLKNQNDTETASIPKLHDWSALIPPISVDMRLSFSITVGATGCIVGGVPDGFFDTNVDNGVRRLVADGTDTTAPHAAFPNVFTEYQGLYMATGAGTFRLFLIGWRW